MPKRINDPNAAARPSKPSNTKGVELPRSIRPSNLKSFSRSHHNVRATPSRESIHGDDDNNSTPNSPHSSTRESEPATDEETQPVLMDHDHGDHIQLETAERQAVAMLNKITKRSERNHQKYDAFRDNISGKDKRIDELHASFEDLASQMAGLEVLCNNDMDADTLDKLFMALPLQQRQLYLGD